MDAEGEVRAAANARADALAAGDRERLAALLHPLFHWTSHRGDAFDRASYLDANTGGTTTWHSQRLEDVTVAVVGDTAVLRCVAVDDVTTAAAGRAIFRMPVTQTWTRTAGRWQCLAGHGGPRLSP